MITFNWHSIRSVNNSQNEGFEELICQLASKEIIPGQVQFFRVGKPDAGKECYWTTKTGDLILWQAKFFMTSFNASQWANIDKSVRRAIDSHRDLSRYIVCFPIDFPDLRHSKKASLLDKWKNKVNEWKKYAAKKIKRNVDFTYWGNSELLSRINKNGNEGLRYFFFNSNEFTDAWFDRKNEDNIIRLGSRYTKSLNLDLPIAKIFTGLSRSDSFRENAEILYREFVNKYKDFEIDEDTNIAPIVSALRASVETVKSIFESIDWTGTATLPLSNLQDLLAKIIDEGLSGIQGYFFTKGYGSGATEEDIKNYQRQRSMFDPFGRQVGKLLDFLSNHEAKLWNSPFLLITGEAGIGKSHLLADAINKRKIDGHISLFLLGEHFTTKELPWTQILNNQLGQRNIDQDTFLTALNAKAESIQSRIIIFIDALNEGEGRSIWPSELPYFINSIARHPWLGLVTTVRDSFADLIAPDQPDRNLLLRYRHTGFSEIGYEATLAFFKYHKIELPSTPILNPEFHNPLFLKLFCIAAQNQLKHEHTFTEIGLSRVIANFVDSIDNKLSRPTELDYDLNKKLVKRSVSKIISKISADNVDTIPYDEASALVDSVFDSQCAKKEPYLRRLIAEGVFREDVKLDQNGKQSIVVFLSYQRLQDFLVAEKLLDEYLVVENDDKIIKDGPILHMLKNEREARNFQNILEALSIQVPERTGKELFELLPHARLFKPIADSFVSSLVWRTNEHIMDGTKLFVSEVIDKNESLTYPFLDTAILLSTRANFFFNADYIHARLLALTLSDRDSFWTIWIHPKYGRNAQINPIKRLIDWAWGNDDKSHISDESIRLSLLLLCWLFSSSNRELRDAATKGAICLLEKRQHLVIPLLTNFQNVNDAYVTERLYCAVYGSAIRSNSTTHLSPISQYIHKHFFSQEIIFPHHLARDYARGVIEYASYRGIRLGFNINDVRPPYKSMPIPTVLPTYEEIERKYRPSGKTGEFGKQNWGATAILESMNFGQNGSLYGDFGHYIFKRTFDDWAIDLLGIHNYAIEKIFNLGYEVKKFNKFDTAQGSGRTSSTGERIGKKYQWLVFHEILARVADHYKMADETDFEGKHQIQCDGPWHPFVRDIDPTMTIRETGQTRTISPASRQWWVSPFNNHDDAPIGHWVRDHRNLPQIASCLERTNNDDGTSWICLEGHPDWRQSELGVNDTTTSPSKRIWYQIRSFLISKKNLTAFKKSFSKLFFRGAFPEARSLYAIFSREYYWSPAFHFFNQTYYNGEDWIDVFAADGTKFVGAVRRTSEYFTWEAEYDHSKETTIGYFKPTQYIKERLSLTFSAREGEFLDQNGQMACFDPSVNNASQSSLFIRKDLLSDFLSQEDLCIIWSLVGEKQILNSKSGDDGTRLNISGFYHLDGIKIKGTLTTKVEGDERLAKKHSVKTQKSQAKISSKGTKNKISTRPKRQKKQKLSIRKSQNK